MIVDIAARDESYELIQEIARLRKELEELQSKNFSNTTLYGTNTGNDQVNCTSETWTYSGSWICVSPTSH